jgi:hypothetical protein
MTYTVEASPRRWAREVGLVAAVLLVVAGGVYTFVHAVAGDRYGPEGWPQHVAIGLPLLAAGMVAVLGSVAWCPWLMVVGGAAAVPICLVSIVGVPALLPAAAVIAVGGTSLGGVSARDGLASIAIVALLVGGFGYEVLHQDPAEWATPYGGAGSSNVVTMTESIVVYVTVGLALVVAIAYSRTNGGRRGAAG